MVHWLLASPQLVEAVHGAGGFVYAWTVDEESRIAMLDGVRVRRRDHQRPQSLRVASSVT